MSKPVTHEEVEDVLSSIRRLVSEDKRPLAGLSNTPRGSDASPRAADARRPVMDRLMLTPALRVADTAPKEPGVAANAPPLDLGSVARQTWLQPDERPQTPQNQDAPSVEGAKQAGETPQDVDYSDENYWLEDEPLPSGAAQSGPQKDQPVAAAPSDTNQATYGDEGDWDDGLEAAEAASTPDHQPEVEADHSEPAINFEELRATSTPLKATIAALGAAIGKTRQEWEPDGDDADALASADVAPMTWEDDVELDAHGKPLRAADGTAQAEGDEADQPGETSIGTAAAGDEQLMDEEALRDLVSEIVRSELQGALGERITRNVRKLVRREIHRALTVQEME